MVVPVVTSSHHLGIEGSVHIGYHCVISAAPTLGLHAQCSMNCDDGVAGALVDDSLTAQLCTECPSTRHRHTCRFPKQFFGHHRCWPQGEQSSILCSNLVLQCKFITIHHSVAAIVVAITSEEVAEDTSTAAVTICTHTQETCSSKRTKNRVKGLPVRCWGLSHRSPHLFLHSVT